jgi:hypothetical protein
MLFGIFPREEKVSWESHLYGFVSGLFAGWGLTSNIFNKLFS